MRIALWQEFGCFEQLWSELLFSSRVVLLDWGMVLVEETLQTSSISESESSRTILESVSIDKDMKLGFSRVTLKKSFLATNSISSSESSKSCSVVWVAWEGFLVFWYKSFRI